MNFLKSIFGGSKQPLTNENRFNTFNQINAEGVLLIPDKLTKALKALFIRAQALFNIPGLKENTYEIIFKNMIYDSAQGNDESLSLKITKTMTINAYKHYDNEGNELLCLMFNDMNNMIYLFECYSSVTSAENFDKLKEFLEKIKFEVVYDTSYLNAEENILRDIIKVINFDNLEIIIKAFLSQKNEQHPIYFDSPTSNQQYNPPSYASSKETTQELGMPTEISHKYQETQEYSQTNTKTNFEFNDHRYQIDSKNSLFACNGSFFTLDELTSQNILISDMCMLNLVRVNQSQFLFAIIVELPDQRRFESDITHFGNLAIPSQGNSFIWVDPRNIAFLFVFKDANAYQSLGIVLARCHLEATQKQNFEEIPIEKEDVKLIESEFIQMHDVEENKELNNIEEVQSHMADFSFQEENKDCLDALSKNRTFILNGKTIQVLKTKEEDDFLENLANIPVINTFKEEVKADQALLFNNENSMLLLEPQKKNLHLMDLETSKVVNTFKLEDEINQICPLSKFGQKTGAKEFLGINNQGYYHFDTRLDPTNIIANSRSYKTSVNFHSINTNLAGGIAIGSKDGSIRLYKNSEAKKAMNLYPGFGDPIIGLDITQDGKWLIGTTEYYLILLPCHKDAISTGFEKQMREDKQPPIKLNLKVTDISKYKLAKEKFIKAGFNEGDKLGCEKWIVAAISNCLVIWDLKNCIKGKKYSYKIKYLKENVISNHFKYNQEDKLIVTYPKTVSLEKRKNY